MSHRLRRHIARKIRRKALAAAATTPWFWGALVLVSLGALLAFVALASIVANSAGACGTAGGGSASTVVAVGGGWMRTGATVDPGPDPKQTANGGMSFAELLVAGTNAGMRPDMTQLLGEPRTAYGMAMGTAVYIRMPGSARAFRIVKSDNGSGQPGNGHFTVDLHSGIASALGWHPNQDVEIKAAGNGQGSALPVSAAVSCTPGATATSASVQAAFDAARQLSAMNVPYVMQHYGNSNNDPHPPYLDCSSSTSWILHHAGMFPGGDPFVSGDFANWGVAGQGQEMTVWYDGGIHVFIEFKIGGRHYQANTSPSSGRTPPLVSGSDSGSGSRLFAWGGPGASDAASGNYQPRHWPNS